MSSLLPAARELSSAPGRPGGSRLEDVERGLLEQALRDTQWNVTQAARRLGISRDTLRYRIEKYRLAAEH